jgi:hypothetical protein
MKKTLLVLLCIPVIGFSQGKLKKATENLSSRPSASSSSSNSSKKRNTDNDNDNFFGDLIAELFFLVSYKIAFGEFEDRYFTKYPYYYDNVDGEYDFGFEKGDKITLIRVGGNYLVGKPVNAIEANINFRFSPFLGIELSKLNFYEKRRGEDDQLNVTSFMFNYYRIRERSMSAWWGIGGTYVGNEIGTTGFSYNYGAELYVFRPMSFHASYKKSFINQSHINVLKLQAKYHQKRMTYYTGYHYISLGGVKIPGVVLGLELTF